jgi:hypothetical protein
MKLPSNGIVGIEPRFRICGLGVFAAATALVFGGLLPYSALGQSWNCGSGACTTTWNVGVATSASPGNPLSVNGVVNAGGNYYNVLSYDYDGLVPNGDGIEIITNIPFTNSTGMPTVNIEGYDYGTGQAVGLSIVWYIYGGSFVSYSASAYGSYTPQIQLSEVSNGGNNVVAIFINDTPYAPRFTIRAFAQGISEAPSWFNGWSAVVTSLSGSNTVTVPYKNSLNAPAGQTVQITGKTSSVTYPNVASAPIAAVTGPATVGGAQWTFALGPNTGYGYYSAIGFDAVHTNGNDETGDLFFATSPFPTTGGQYTAPQERMRITASGLVDIGTNEETCATSTTVPCKLAVTGAIVAQEVVVNSAGADYVFDPDYRLRPLSEIAEYIEANHHLPDVPSAKEASEKGVSVGEMQAKLLAKIEELTLHAIKAEERGDRLERENGELRERVARIEAGRLAGAK